jgi:hypothetical protein
LVKRVIEKHRAYGIPHGLVLYRCTFAAGYSDKWLCAPAEQLRKVKHNTSVFKCTCIRSFAPTYISVILNIWNGYVKGESKISLLQGIHMEKSYFRIGLKEVWCEM